MNRNVYILPCGDYFDLKEIGACYLVFSPLKNKFTLVDATTAEKVRRGDALQEFIPNTLPDLSVPSRDPTSMMFLLNERCNFSCSYCYSAESRSGAEMSVDVLRKGIEALHEAAIKHKRNSVKVTFIGGGEPMLSWALIRTGVEYGGEIELRDGVTTRYVLVTNGSIFDAEQIDFCRSHKFEIQVSFEVLKDVQDAQRKHYDLVSENITRLCDAGLNVSIRSTITYLNVDRICAMCKECLLKFPKVRQLACEPVADAAAFVTPEAVRDFADRYFAAFKAAKELVRDTGLELSTSFSRTWRGYRMRFCGPLFAVTPTGVLTGCSHFSRDGSEGLSHFKFGEIDGTGLHVDEFEFESVFATPSDPVCERCWARWNCGGGCPNHRYIYTAEVFAELCRLRRRMLKLELLNELSRQYENKTGKSFKADMVARLGGQRLECTLKSRDSYAEFATLYVLPNQRCNFNCSYCYAATDRSDEEIDPKALQRFMRYFMDGKRPAGNQRRIVFLGGGEPLLSWNLIADAVLFAEKVATEQCVHLSLTLITNLSLINEERISFLREHKVKVKVSFDILEGLQNRNRGHYDLVAANLRALLNGGVATEVQSTILPETVDRMPDMVDELVAKYPNVDGAVFEMVRGDAFFPSAAAVTRYIDAFYVSWCLARETAKRAGLHLFNSFVASSTIHRDRYCGGLFVLMPSGDISLCMHIGSRSAPGYGNRVFGHVDADCIEFDDARFAQIFSASPVGDGRCAACWARSHCAGGCPNSAAMYPTDVIEAFCSGMRRVIAREIGIRYGELETV